jgi:hypothetical protein
VQRPDTPEEEKRSSRGTRRMQRGWGWRKREENFSPMFSLPVLLAPFYE